MALLYGSQVTHNERSAMGYNARPTDRLANLEHLRGAVDVLQNAAQTVNAIAQSYTDTIDRLGTHDNVGEVLVNETEEIEQAVKALENRCGRLVTEQALQLVRDDHDAEGRDK